MAMFIHTSRAGETVFCTLDVEPVTGSAVSTTTRMTIEDARQLVSQLEKLITDHAFENDPHEQHAALDAYYADQIGSDLPVDGPF